MQLVCSAKVIGKNLSGECRNNVGDAPRLSLSVTERCILQPGVVLHLAVETLARRQPVGGILILVLLCYTCTSMVPLLSAESQALIAGGQRISYLRCF